MISHPIGTRIRWSDAFSSFLPTPGPRTASVSSVDRVAKATAFLVFLMPFDGFNWQVYGIGLVAIAGYLVFATAVSRIPSIIESQPLVFWLWAGTFSIGTALALLTHLANSSHIDEEIATAWQMMAFWALVTYVCRVQESRELLLTSFATGLVLSMVAYVFQYLIGFEVRELTDRVFSVGSFQANHAAFSAAICLFVLLGRFHRGPWRILFFSFIGGLACIYVLLLSNSRSAFLSLIVGLLTFLLPNSRRARFVKLRLAAIVIGGTIVIFVSLGSQTANGLFLHLMNRWDTAQNANDLTAGRSQIWAMGFRLAGENPVGYGIGRAKFLLAQNGKVFVVTRDNNRIIDAHNEYLRMLLDSGYLGLSLYIIGCVVLIRTAARKFIRQGEIWPLATLLLILTFFMSGSAGFIKITWVALGLITGSATIPVECRRPWLRIQQHGTISK